MKNKIVENKTNNQLSLETKCVEYARYQSTLVYRMFNMTIQKQSEKQMNKRPSPQSSRYEEHNKVVFWFLIEATSLLMDLHRL